MSAVVTGGVHYCPGQYHFSLQTFWPATDIISLDYTLSSFTSFNILTSEFFLSLILQGLYKQPSHVE
jgi:hypothetical protein